MATHGFSRSTWNGRFRVLRSLVPLKHNPRLAVNRFLATRLRQQLKPDTVARDISHVRWVLKLWEVKDAVIEASLTAIRRGLKENEVLLPKAKALPMSRAVLNQFLNHKRIPKPVKVVIKLAFETGSRLGDIFALRPEKALRPMADGRLLICWGITKTHRTVEARADHQQIVDHPGCVMTLIDEPNLLSQTSPKQVRKILHLFKPTTQYIQRWQALNNTVTIRSRFTGHSMKRGRAAELWQQAAQGTVTIATVMHELKHQSLEAALAYAPSPQLTAQAIQLRNASNTASQSTKKRKQ